MSRGACARSYRVCGPSLVLHTLMLLSSGGICTPIFSHHTSKSVGTLTSC